MGSETPNVSVKVIWTLLGGCGHLFGGWEGSWEQLNSCPLLGSRAMKMLLGQIEVHFQEAKGLAEKEIVSEDGRESCKASLTAKPCVPPVVWHARVSPDLPMHECHSDQ